MFNSYAYGTTSQPLTNNPFIDHSSSTAQRYPDISQSSDTPSWATSTQYQQQQQQHPQQYQQQQNQWQGNGLYNSQAQQPQPTSFQPQSSFGQSLISGSSYGYMNGATQQQQPQTGYNPVQQQLQSANYLAQFDPYSAISQGWGGDSSSMNGSSGSSIQQQQPHQQQYSSSITSSSSHINTPVPALVSPSTAIFSTSVSASGDPHPREYIRTYKASIESWDPTTWKGFLALFEKLKVAWEARVKETEARVGVLNTQLGAVQMQVQGYAGYMQVQQYQQEVSRVQGLVKEAEANADSVAASSFQMQEVFYGYRQSGDSASKRRVREATNAALQSLPDWPQAVI